jgi:hypothetical protein
MSVGYKIMRYLGLLAAWLGCSLGYAPAFAVGLMPVPVLQDVQMRAQVSVDAATDRYTYVYTVSNPASNSGQIWDIEIDTTHAGDVRWMDSTGLTVPKGFATKTFDEQLAAAQPLDLPPGTTVIPFGFKVPAGWGGTFGRNGLASFFSSGPSVRILPGQTRTGFELISPGLPGIRVAIVEPKWVHLVNNIDDVTEEEELAAKEVERQLPFHTVTLGPSGVYPGSFEHWNQLRDDLNKAIGLGWIPDTTLGNTLVTQLAAARAALDASDGTLAKSRLGTLLATLGGATPASRRQEVYDLVFLNAQRLVATTPDTPIPFEPKVTLTPPKVTLPLGAEHTLTATAINLGDGRPLVGFRLGFRVVAGPHSQPFPTSGFTDSAGTLTFSYVGKKPGTDTIKLTQEGGEMPTDFGTAEATWKDGSDLIIKLFIPPLIKNKGGAVIPITEITGNAGNRTAAASTTRYFLSQDDIIDPTQDQPLGERQVGSLTPDESSRSGSAAQITLPAALPEGTYHLGACADAKGAVVELDELNNCKVNQIVVALEPGPIENLAARAKDAKIDLTWAAIQGAVNYNIYRGTVAGGPYQLIKAGHVTNYATYADFGLTNGVTYYYTVRWVLDGGWESPPSNEARATPAARSTR